MTRPPDLLVVDDDPACLEYLRLALSRDGYRVRTAGNGVEGLRALEEEPADLVLSDLRMPVLDGTEFLHRVRQRWPQLPFVLITVEQDLPTVVEAVHLGATNYLIKPVGPDTLRDAVRRALSFRAEPARASEAFPEIIGRSPSMVLIRHVLTLASRSEVNVLVTGETGTGKELVARALHRNSGRARGPFVAHNCAVTAGDLFDGEFFGHARGAYTGADRDHAGILERADGGILFLDELETLSPANQAKLLRVVDDGEVRRLGSAHHRKVCIRFVAATNVDPRRMAAEGRFRQDLYFRLRGYEISMPPLRERREDIPLLTACFLGGEHPGVEPEASEALAAYHWPGNVRELRNVLRVADAGAGSGARKLRLRDFPPELRSRGRREAAGHPVTDATDHPVDVGGWTHRETLKDLERRALIEALQRNGGNRTRAAETLGIDRSTLRRKMEQFGLS